MDEPGNLNDTEISVSRDRILPCVHCGKRANERPQSALQEHCEHEYGAASAVRAKEAMHKPDLARRTLRAYRLTIDAIRDAAWECGYAVAVHGSLARDIDLVAIPWTESAVTAEDVAETIRAAAEQSGPCGVAFMAGTEPCPRKKPHGRLCWSFHLGGGPYIDLSVMPRDSEAS